MMDPVLSPVVPREGVLKSQSPSNPSNRKLRHSLRAACAAGQPGAVTIDAAFDEFIDLGNGWFIGVFWRDSGTKQQL